MTSKSEVTHLPKQEQKSPKKLGMKHIIEQNDHVKQLLIVSGHANIPFAVCAQVEGQITLLISTFLPGLQERH